MGKFCYTLLALLLCFMPLLIMCLPPSVDNNSTTLKQSWCVEEERVALLTLKQSFKDPHHRLESWQGPDCCSWLGVSCHKFTKRVVELDLRASLYFDYFSFDVFKVYSPLNPLETSKLNPSLVKLKYLKYLDLSGNRFNGSSIPPFLGHMKRLTYLNLSNTDFYGIVPRHLGNLSSLEVLDLSGIGGHSSTPIYVDGFNWVSGLSSLQYLDMGGVDLQRAGYLAQVLNHLPSLLHLGLFNCRLSYPNLIACIPLINSSIQHLDLSWNFFGGPIPASIRNMTSLHFLDLQFNYLSISVPLWLGNLKNLEHLNLAHNHLIGIEGGLWSVLRNLCHLQSLDLSWNFFDGDSFLTESSNQVNMSVCTRYELETISLCHSRFSDYLPDWMGMLQNLKKLHAASNSFHGSIPSAFGKLTSLRELDLSYNNLNGTIPAFIGSFSALRKLNLSHNQLSGKIPKNTGDLKLLQSLDLSENKLWGAIPESLSDLTSLSYMNLSHNNLAGEIPKGNQLQTLADPSFYEGNAQLCGAPLPKRCSGSGGGRDQQQRQQQDDDDNHSDKLWFYLIGFLLINKRWRRAFFKMVDETKDKIYVALAVKNKKKIIKNGQQENK